jgi:kanamycin kinase
LAAGHPLRTVWQNQLGGLTFEVVGGAGPRFIKWSPRSSGIELTGEAVRLRWASPFTPVPHVVDSGSDVDGSWMVLEPVPGDNAVSDRWQAAPSAAVSAIGEGLRAFHEALPVDTCPFSWSAEDRLDDARRRGALGLLDPGTWHPEHTRLTVPEALDLLAEVPSVGRAVVCHGDPCAPNTMVADDGHWSGHVDLGALGVADPWADLAVATWSATWNYGPGWEERLLSAYGVAPDPDRTRYYRLLWDVGP